MNKTVQMITARIVFTEPNGTQFLHCQMSQMLKFFLEHSAKTNIPYSVGLNHPQISMNVHLT